MAHDASKSVQFSCRPLCAFMSFSDVIVANKNDFQKSKYRPHGYFRLRLDCGLITFL